MSPYFVDTWYLIARFDRFDEAHRRTLMIERRLAGGVLVTHDGVLTEFLAFFSGYGAHNRRGAVHFVRELMRRAVVVPSDRSLFLAGLDRYAARPDKEWSHVDCMSMVVMEERGIRHVLTNDHHFSQAGFSVVSE